MGGVGKTTLAQLAYNNNKVKSNFDKRIWVSVSDPFDNIRIAKAIVETLKGEDVPNLGQFQSLLNFIYESIGEKKFLLVLDDVWGEDYSKWEQLHHCLKSGLDGSKILVTTRKESVAHMMRSLKIIPVEELSEENCWSLFWRLAFFVKSREEFQQLEDIGRKIVRKCKGLPLAAKTMGRFLCIKKTRADWECILESEMRKREEFEKRIFPPLLMSYNNLRSMVRRCFSFCAIFSKDYNIDENELIKSWMAQGYLGLEQDIDMEMIGEKYFDHLATRSFFQEFEKSEKGSNTFSKMHDIVHDFAQFLTENECFTIGVDGSEELSTVSSYENAQHLMLITNNQAFPAFICNM